jgi:DNA-binding LytR/AlgR family response regulator
VSIRVLLADDQALVRGAMAALLSLETDLEVVAEVGRGDEVVEAARRSGAQVCLLDIEMPGADGIEAAHWSSPPVVGPATSGVRSTSAPVGSSSRTPLPESSRKRSDACMPDCE